MRRVPLLLLALLCCAAAACGGETREDPDSGAARIDSPDTSRVDTRIDTLLIEGTPESLSLRLFRTSDDFPLPFGAYVPEDMIPDADPDAGTVHITAAFGGSTNDDAFLHLFVFPEGTPLQEAVASARGYRASRGVPVSTGIEPLAGAAPAPELGWAVESYRFRYQSGGQWFAGALGVGFRARRHFMIIWHYPVEFGDGFGPRVDLILDTWRWADGGRLEEAEAEGVPGG